MSARQRDFCVAEFNWVLENVTVYTRNRISGTTIMRFALQTYRTERLRSRQHNSILTFPILFYRRIDSIAIFHFQDLTTICSDLYLDASTSADIYFLTREKTLTSANTKDANQRIASWRHKEAP